MKIIKSNSFQSRKCEFGDYELIPDNGWKLSYSFIDFESKLLVVSVSCEDKSKWTNNGYNGWSIPTKEFKINLETLQILEFEEWKHYFNYEKTEFISEDKKYKLITQRVYEPNRNSDGIKEELYDLDSNRLISSCDSVAFREERRENLLEDLYNSIQEEFEQKRILDAKPNLEEYYLRELSKLKENDVIIAYFDNSNTYKLVFTSEKLSLFIANRIPSEYGDWKNMEFEIAKTYYSIDDFWDDFTKEKKWFLKYLIHESISEKSSVLAKHIISYFNDLRKEHKFTFNEYHFINLWQNSVWSDEFKRTELKQWCSNCYEEVYFQGRYPKYICGNCSNKEITDKNGNLLEFSNLGFSGGFKIIKKNREGVIIEENEDEEFCDCLIDGKEFFAEEARFGGIVIQLKE